MPIISEAVFSAMDRNKDGFVSRGELKLALQDISLKDLMAIIDEIDEDNDGKLTYDEVKAISKRAHEFKVRKVFRSKLG